jgi:hypothetical protein
MSRSRTVTSSCRIILGVERPEEELVRIQRLVEEDEDASNDEPADEEAAV